VVYGLLGLLRHHVDAVLMCWPWLKRVVSSQSRVEGLELVLRKSTSELIQLALTELNLKPHQTQNPLPRNLGLRHTIAVVTHTS
jgi:hypothetical protein